MNGHCHLNRTTCSVCGHSAAETVRARTILAPARLVLPRRRRAPRPKGRGKVLAVLLLAAAILPVAGMAEQALVTLIGP